jgi:hypothetical protein
MKKYILLGSIFASVFMLGSCDYNEDNFPGYDEYDTIKDIRNDTITLEAADYATIAKLQANKDLALSKDPEAESYLKALEAVGKNQFFTDMILPEEFLPAYIANRFPYLSDNSKVLVNYRFAQDLPAYLSQLSTARTYQFETEDYKSVWGDKVDAKYLSPSTISKIPAILKAANQTAKQGDVLMVEYAFSETEPSIGGGGVTPEPTYTPISEIIAGGVGEYTAKGTVVGTYGRGFLLNDGTASILVYLNKPANYSIGDVLTVAGTTSIYSGLSQFPQSSEVKLLERSKTFAYPTAVSMSGAEMDKWTENAAIKYVSITGKLVISGKYLNLEVEGATRQGSISYPVAGLVDETLNGQNVTVTGYLIGYSKSFVNIMATSVVAEGTKNAYTPIGVVALSNAGSYTVKGSVVATYDRGFLLNDGTGSILVYLNKNYTEKRKIGDIVTVAGQTSEYAGLKQFTDQSIVTLIKESTDWVYPDLLQLKGEDMDAYLESPYVAYVSYEGVLKIDGFYYNITIEGAEKAIGSLSYVPEGVVDNTLNGKKVRVEGYSIGVSGGRYVNTMVVSVADASTAVTKSMLATRAVIEPNTYAVYQFNGSAWNEYEPEDETVSLAVMQPADYKPLGYNSISNPSEVLPIYLKNCCPYAQSGDKKAVVYYYYADKVTSVAASEYTFDGAVWVETVNSVPAAMMFMQVNNSWKEAVEYYANTFAGELHGDAVIVDVELGGKDYVWSTLATSAHIQASGYYQQNRVTESWLITPKINLTEAIAPKMVFEAAISYLYSGKITDHIQVCVSTDYVPNAEKAKEAVQAAKWDVISFDKWVSGSTFEEMQADMAAYKGQQIYVAFKYSSNTECAPTLKLKNFAVKE